MKEKKRMKALRDIFDFYCKQHITYGKNVATFDNLGMNLTNLSAGDWMCFTRDFGIRAKNKLSVKASDRLTLDRD